MRRVTLADVLGLPLWLTVLAGCNSPVVSTEPPQDAGADGAFACVGRFCQVSTSCASSPTTLTGRVTIPSGKLPLYNAKVYIPVAAVPPPPESGASCDRCDQAVPPDAVVSTTTDSDGRFELKNVPSGASVPLVIQVGKWRRVVDVKNIVDCTSTALPAADTRLPAKQSEGNIPRIALTTGKADALECLLRSKKLGLDDSEFTLPTGSGRVNYFTGTGGSANYVNGFNGATAPVTFPTANPWWSSYDNLKKYDVLILSCEEAQNANTKDNNAHWALQNYIEAGGRVFASHWHNVWFNATPAPPQGYTPALLGMPMSSVGSFPTSGGTMYTNPITATLNTGPPPAQSNYDKQNALADWLKVLNPGQNRGEIVINNGRTTINSVTASLITTWVTYSGLPQYFSFFAPIGASQAQQCGQMVFTDMHVTAGTGSDTPAQPFPNGCVVNPTLSQQEQALIFMLFDLSNCLQPPIG